MIIEKCLYIAIFKTALNRLIICSAFINRRGDNTMHKAKKLTKNIWIVIMILSLLLTAMPLLKLIEIVLTGSGSSFIPEKLDEGAFASFKLIMIFWLMYLIIGGFWGLFCSWGLKKKESFAWKLGVFWSLLLILYGIISSLSEILISWVHKPLVCAYFMTSIVFGVIALVCLLVTKKGFVQIETAES